MSKPEDRKRYPLNNKTDLPLRRRISGLPEKEALRQVIKEEVPKFVSGGTGGGGGLFSCGALSSCRTEICQIVSDCTTGSDVCPVSCQTQINKLKDILQKLVSCYGENCPAITDEDKNWLGVQE